jgi:hypothetical protein
MDEEAERRCEENGSDDQVLAEPLELMISLMYHLPSFALALSFA